jgi:hypothetical protein
MDAMKDVKMTFNYKLGCMVVMMIMLFEGISLDGP